MGQPEMDTLKKEEEKNEQKYVHRIYDIRVCINWQ